MNTRKNQKEIDELDDQELARRTACASAEPDRWEETTVAKLQAELEACRDINNLGWLHYEIMLAKRQRKLHPGKPFYRLKPKGAA